MKPRDLRLPDGVEVLGELIDTSEPDHLLQDLLQVKLPSGVIIDVGWYPECDPTGHYRVVAFRDNWCNQLDSVQTREMSSVVATVQRLATKFLSNATSAGSEVLEATDAESVEACRRRAF